MKLLILLVLIAIFLLILFLRFVAHRNTKVLLDLSEQIKYSPISQENYDAITKEFDSLNFMNKETKCLWFAFQLKFKKYSPYRIVYENNTPHTPAVNLN